MAEGWEEMAETDHCSSITTFSHICNTRALSSHRSAVMMETSLARFLCHSISLISSSTDTVIVGAQKTSENSHYIWLEAIFFPCKIHYLSKLEARCT